MSTSEREKYYNSILEKTEFNKFLEQFYPKEGVDIHVNTKRISFHLLNMLLCS